MKFEKFEVEYDDSTHYYQYQYLQARRSSRHSMFIMQTMLPLLDGMDADIKDFASGLSKIDPDVLCDLMEEFLANTKHKDINKNEYVPYDYQNHFHGKILLMYKVFLECLKIEYKDFFLMFKGLGLSSPKDLGGLFSETTGQK